MIGQSLPQFPLGKTWYDGATPNSADVITCLGYEKWFEINRGGVTRMTKYRLVRNMSSGTLAAKACVLFHLSPTSPDLYGSEVNGVAGAAAYGRPVDEFIPSTVARYDCFWLAVEGPAKCITSTNTAIAIGDILDTASSGNVIATSSSTARLYAQVGRAMEAVAASATDILVNISAAT